jgi:LuxR family maltose regulon positive regulatory protein
MILQGFARYFLGLVHYSWNELEVAGQHFEEGVAKRYSIHALAARNCMIGLARLHLARANKDEIWGMMDLLSQLDMERTGPEAADTRSFRAQLDNLHGNAEAAYRWADAYTTPVPDRLLNFLQDPHIVRAQILLARGTSADVQEALVLLDTLHGNAQRSFSVRLQIEVLAVRALAFERQGKTVAAIATLEQAVELARQGGFIRVFVDLGPHMQTLLLRLAGRGFAYETVRRILAAFPAQPQKVQPNAGYRVLTANAGLIEPLTERELDILVLLRERLSNKEIAAHLGLSIMTVKRHASNIYDKLGVENRRDAVIKAETLKILPSA